MNAAKQFDRHGIKTWYTGCKRLLSSINIDVNDATSLAKLEWLRRCKMSILNIGKMISQE